MLPSSSLSVLLTHNFYVLVECQPSGNQITPEIIYPSGIFTIVKYRTPPQKSSEVQKFHKTRFQCSNTLGNYGRSKNKDQRAPLPMCSLISDNTK